MQLVRSQSVGEEIANSITHGIGAVASLVALPILFIDAAARNDMWLLVGYLVFAISSLLLYTSSTLYHALPHSRAKEVFHRLDHAAIYIMIAGTYTPFTLGFMRGTWGWTLFGLVWGLAAAGVLYKTVVGARLHGLSTALYIGMGWLGVIAFQPIMQHMPPAGILWLVAGGLLYTGGVAFFHWERLRYSHMIWHLFVLAGTLCHFMAVWWYAAPHTI